MLQLLPVTPPIPATPVRPAPIGAGAPITDLPPTAAVTAAAPDRTAVISGILDEAVTADGDGDARGHRHGLRPLRREAHPHDQGDGGGECENGRAHHSLHLKKARSVGNAR